VHQPPGIRHREIGHSPDVELLEVVMPGDFKTVGVDDLGAPPIAGRENSDAPRQ
jgi:hypothetical protein